MVNILGWVFGFVMTIILCIVVRKHTRMEFELAMSLICTLISFCGVIDDIAEQAEELECCVCDAATGKYNAIYNECLKDVKDLLYKFGFSLPS
jgi:hypothetical protein